MDKGSPEAVGQLLNRLPVTQVALLLAEVNVEEAAQLVLAQRRGLYGAVSSQADTRVAFVPDQIVNVFKELQPSFREELYVALEKRTSAFANALRKRLPTPVLATNRGNP